MASSMNKISGSGSDADGTSESGTENRKGVAGSILRKWFALTFDERTALLVVLTLALLGIGAKIWR